MNWHKNFLIQPGQVFVVWTDGWRTCAGVLGLSSPLIGQLRYNSALWLADQDNKVDRVNETDPGHLCLIVSQICWLIKYFGWTYFCFHPNILFDCSWQRCMKTFYAIRFIDLKHWGVRMKSSRACFEFVFVHSYHRVIYAKQWWMMNPT